MTASEKLLLFALEAARPDQFDALLAAVSDWLAGRAVPSLRVGLCRQAFLAQQRRRQ